MGYFPGIIIFKSLSLGTSWQQEYYSEIQAVVTIILFYNDFFSFILHTNNPIKLPELVSMLNWNNFLVTTSSDLIMHKMTDGDWYLLLDTFSIQGAGTGSFPPIHKPHRLETPKPHHSYVKGIQFNSNVIE